MYFLIKIKYQAVYLIFQPIRDYYLHQIKSCYYSNEHVLCVIFPVYNTHADWYNSRMVNYFR